MAEQAPDLTGLVAHLAKAGVEFVVVGGLAAVAQGAPLSTFDVDIVPHRTAENVGRLASALEDLDARYRGRAPAAIIRPDATALLGEGHHQLLTRLGPLDVLGVVEGGRAFDDLVPRSVHVTLRDSDVKLLSLEGLIELKESSSRTKDKLALPVLRAVLRARGSK